MYDFSVFGAGCGLIQANECKPCACVLPELPELPELRELPELPEPGRKLPITGNYIGKTIVRLHIQQQNDIKKREEMK